MIAPHNQPSRVVCLGLNRTGTSSLRECFEILRLTPIAAANSFPPDVAQRSDRGYFTRLDILYRHGYGPAADLAEDESGCLRWSSPKLSLRHEVEAYFLSRREDV